MATHKWYFRIKDVARKQIRELPSKDRMAVFRSIVDLLESDKPKEVIGVKKLREKKFEGKWRQRQGDWRIFFSVESGEITVEKFTYKGSITVEEVLHRSKAYD